MTSFVRSVAQGRQPIAGDRLRAAAQIRRSARSLGAGAVSPECADEARSRMTTYRRDLEDDVVGRRTRCLASGIHLAVVRVIAFTNLAMDARPQVRPHPHPVICERGVVSKPGPVAIIGRLI